MKTTAAKFWVALVCAELTTAATLGLPGWWGKGVAIASALAGTALVYLTPNKELPAEETVHSGQ